MPGLVVREERSLMITADLEPENFEALVKNIGLVEGLSGYKIGSEVGLGMSLAGATEIVKNNNELAVAIYDHQKAGTDIPDSADGFAQTMVKGEVDAAILFPFTGPQVEEAYIKALQQAEVGVLIGSDMTHEQQRQSEGGYISDDAILRMFYQAIDLGVRDFVVPGNKPGKVKYYKRFFDTELGANEYSLFSTGFVAQGGEVGRTRNEAGRSWHAFIGRAIIQAADQKNAAIQYAQQILFNN